MPEVKPWNRIPSIHNAQMSPAVMAEKLREITGRLVVLKDFDSFKADLVAHAKTAEELLPYVHLTQLFPRCTQAVLDGSEKVSSHHKPLIMLARQFPGCKHALIALYDWHPVVDSPWNDALYDHVRIWTWKHCEICEAKEMKPV
jgi:hypothetical protein